MSYRISYLMPKKEFKRLLLGKKQSQVVQEAPAKKSSTPSRKAKPKKASSAPRRHAKSKTTKKRERSKKVKSPNREKTRGKQSSVTFDPDTDEFIESIVRDNKMYSSDTLDFLKKYEI